MISSGASANVATKYESNSVSETAKRPANSSTNTPRRRNLDLLDETMDAISRIDTNEKL